MRFKQSRRKEMEAKCTQMPGVKELYKYIVNLGPALTEVASGVMWCMI